MLFVEDSTPVIVQGMTGHQGMTHTARMLKAGTKHRRRCESAQGRHVRHVPGRQERHRRGCACVRHLRRSP